MTSVQNKNIFYLWTFVLTCCLFLPLLLPAQSVRKAKIDSVINILNTAKEDTDKVMLLCSLAQRYPDYDPNKGIEVARQAIALSEKLQFERGIAFSNICAGLNEISRTEYASAQKYFRAGLEKAREMNDAALEETALKNTGVCYYEQNNIPESLNSFFQSLHIAEERHSRKEIFYLLEQIGRAYEAQKLFDKALQYYKRSYDSAVAAGENIARGKNLMNIGQVYQQLFRNNEALACFKDAYAVFQQFNDVNGMAFCNAGMGASYNELHQYREALDRSREALAFYTKYSDRINIASTLGIIGKTYLYISRDTFGTVIPADPCDKKKALDSSFYYLNRSLRLCDELSYLEGLCNNYHDISIAWEQKGNNSEALNTYKQYINIRDSIYSADNNIKITNLEINREMEIKDKQLQLKRLELAKKRNENFFFISGIVLLLIVSIILFFNFNTQKKLNATISKLVDEQEKTIALRTEALTQSNEKLVDLIQFNAHNLREPITRIMGLLMMHKDVSHEEFFDTCIPMMEETITGLDNTLKEVIMTSEQTKKEK